MTIRPPDRQRGEQQDKQDRYQDAVHDYRTWRSGARFQLSVRRRRLSGRPTRQRPIADRNLQGLQAQVWRRANPLCGFRSRAGCAGSMLQPRRLCPNPGDSRQAFATPGSQWYHSKAETRWADAMKPGAAPASGSLPAQAPPGGRPSKHSFAYIHKSTHPRVVWFSAFSSERTLNPRMVETHAGKRGMISTMKTMSPLLRG
jgi:hypothetical protein